MSVGLFYLPLGYAMQTYKDTCFEFPLVERVRSGERRVYKNDPRYNSLLASLPGHQIKDDMKPFLARHQIREDLIFVETPNLGVGVANGSNRFTRHDAAIFIAPGFYDTDKDACCFLLKHEISHIKNNDVFTIALVPAICSLSIVIFGMFFLSFLATICLGVSISEISKSLFSQWREAKADDFAIQNSSDEELKAGRRLLIAMQAVNIDECKAFWKRIMTSANGDNRLDIFHPSLTSRIQKIDKTLYNRHVEIDEVIERHKIDILKAFLGAKTREVEQIIQQQGGIFALVLKKLFSLGEVMTSSFGYYAQVANSGGSRVESYVAALQGKLEVKNYSVITKKILQVVTAVFVFFAKAILRYDSYNIDRYKTCFVNDYKIRGALGFKSWDDVPLEGNLAAGARRIYRTTYTVVGANNERKEVSAIAYDVHIENSGVTTDKARFLLYTGENYFFGKHVPQQEEPFQGLSWNLDFQLPQNMSLVEESQDGSVIRKLVEKQTEAIDPFVPPVFNWNVVDLVVLQNPANNIANNITPKKLEWLHDLLKQGAIIDFGRANNEHDFWGHIVNSPRHIE